MTEQVGLPKRSKPLTASRMSDIVIYAQSAVYNLIQHQAATPMPDNPYTQPREKALFDEVCQAMIKACSNG
jgi:hypothetical protein